MTEEGWDGRGLLVFTTQRERSDVICGKSSYKSKRSIGMTWDGEFSFSHAKRVQTPAMRVSRVGVYCILTLLTECAFITYTEGRG